MKKISWPLFAFGLCSKLALFGSSLSISELMCLVIAPFLVANEYPCMRRNGIAMLFWLSILLVLNASLSCLYNHTAFVFVLRGMATVCLLPCAIVVAHWLLRRDMAGYKWYFIGGALSLVINVFAFQNSVEVHAWAGGARGVEAAAGIMSGPLFWISRIKPFVMLWPNGWYLQCPTIVCVVAVVGFAMFSMLTSESGRSASLSAFAAAVLLIIGGKTRASIRNNICRRVGVILVCAIVFVLLFKGAYQFSVTRGWLGEKAQHKYERQTKGNTSMVALLIGGRAESFSGLPACFDHPIIGFGPWAIDRHGYTDYFMRKYANIEVYEERLRVKEIAARAGRLTDEMIGAHSHITEFWSWYGIFGLVFWLYILRICFRHFSQDAFVVPQWYLWIMCGIPSFLWGVFFSPMSDRFGEMFFCVALLLTRAVRLGVQHLPEKMIREIVESERRHSR